MKLKYKNKYEEYVSNDVSSDTNVSIDIDLYNILKNRSAFIVINNNKLSKKLDDFSFKNVKEELNINNLSELYDFLNTYFDSFKYFISEKDRNKKKHLTTTMPNYVYLAICNLLNNKVIYDFDTKRTITIPGGFVSKPQVEHATGNIYVFDFNSMYTHILIQNDFYNEKIRQLLKLLYYLRLYYKRQVIVINNKEQIVSMKNIEQYKNEFYYKVDIKNKKLIKEKITDEVINEFEKLVKQGIDNKQYAVKIILNIFFGLLDQPYYKLVYDEKSAYNCTVIGQKWIKYARTVFKNKGYELLYTDTDSIILKDGYNDKEKMLKIKNEIINNIKKEVLYPQITFDMKIETEISEIYFFKSESGEFLKKNYLYITKENKVGIKNLSIKKQNTSKLSKLIFKEYIIPNIIKKKKIKFDEVEIKNIIKKKLRKDYKLGVIRKEIKEKYDSKTSLQYKLLKMYGSGVKFLVPNTKKVGAGDKTCFCSLGDYKRNNLDVADIDLNVYINELKYFINKNEFKQMFI